MFARLCIKWRHSSLQTKLYIGFFIVTLSAWTLSVLISMRGERLSTAQSEGERALHQLASQLQLTFSVISNTGPNHSAQISLSSPLTDRPLGAGFHWRLYFSLMRPVLLADDGPSVGFRLHHLNGYLHRLEPCGEVASSGLAPGRQYNIKYIGKNAVVSRYDSFPNWYAVLVDSSGAEVAADVLAVTASEDLDFVQPLTRPEQYKARPGDSNEPWTPFKRAAIQAGYLGDERPGPDLVRLVPKPVLAEPLDSRQLVADTNCLLAGLTVAESAPAVGAEDDGCRLARASEAAGQLIRQAAIEAASASAGSACFGSSNRRWVAQLRLCGSAGRFSSLTKNMTADQVSEVYELSIDPQSGRVTLRAAQPAGLFWAAQSLVSLLQPGGRLTVGRIFDYPRAPYRGLMLDVARNFMPASQVMRIIDAMSAFKLNRLHLHLSDDEGLRLPVTAAFPVASRRCHPLSGVARPACAQPPQLGSDPNSWDAAPGSGSFSAQDYAKILRHAARRFVRVVPELDTPAHSLAAILALKAGHTDLLDPEDPGGMRSPQAFANNSVNPCMPAGSQFIQELLSGARQLHSQSGHPLLEYHFGGDEAPRGTWTQSPACRRMLGLRPDQLVDADIVSRINLHRLMEAAADAGVQALLGWADGFADTNLLPFNLSSLAAGSRRPPRVVAVPWHTRPSLRSLATAGYSLLMAPANRLYLDIRQEPDPEERGLYWAANFTDLHAVFTYDAAEADASAGPGADILGLSGALWTETARQPEHVFGLLAPRLLALAERAWRRGEWEAGQDAPKALKQRRRDWAEFVSSVGHRELSRLAKMGLQFRVAPPGAKPLGGAGGFSLTHELPGVRLFYSLDAASQNRRWVESDKLAEWPSGVRRIYLMAAYSSPGSRNGFFAQSRVVHVDR